MAILLQSEKSANGLIRPNAFRFQIPKLLESIKNFFRLRDLKTLQQPRIPVPVSFSALPSNW